MKQRVFIAADHKRMRELLVDLFSSRGLFQLVGTACTEPEASNWLTEHRQAWDLAVIDLVLDEGSGTAVLQFAREQHYGGVIAVLSSCVTDTLREHCYALGADSIFDEAETGRFILWLDKVGAALPPPASALQVAAASTAARH